MRVHQALLNLLTNAVKYTKEGSVTFSVTGTIHNYDRILLEAVVSDTGIGIKSEDIPVVFNKFQRADITKNCTIEGTGLGLAITKSIADLMHGDISVESVYGEGSKFTIHLMQNVYGTAKIDMCLDSIKSSEIMTFKAKGIKLLTVDDSNVNLRVIQGLLSDSEMIVDVASSGKECLDLLRNGNSYDIILMDSRMPEMNGSETLSIIRSEKLAANTKIAVLTADVMNNAADNYLQEGFDAYIAKPVRPNDLFAELMNLLPDNAYTLTKVEASNSGLPDWLYNSREIDPNVGISMCGDVDNYIEVLREFVISTQETLQSIRHAHEHKDYAFVTTKSHALKSSAKIIGAMRLSNIAYEVEKAGKDGDYDYVDSHLGSMLSLCGEIASLLAPLVISTTTTVNDADKEEIDAEHVHGLFAHLKGYVDDFNDPAVSSMLNALSSFQFPGESQKLFENLVSAFNDLDWATMQELLENY